MEKFILKPISGNKIKKGFFRICKEGKKDTLLSTITSKLLMSLKEMSDTSMQEWLFYNLQ